VPLVLDTAAFEREFPGESPQLIRERLSVDRVEALRVLGELLDSGKLVRLGERRGVRYEIAAK
jgi:hypothetical protein